MSDSNDHTAERELWCALPIQADEYPELTEAVTQVGYRALHYPVVLTEPRPAEELGPFLEELSQADESWILLTSPGAAEALLALLKAAAEDGTLLPNLSSWRVATVGEATARAMEALSRDVQHIALAEIRAGSPDKNEEDTGSTVRAKVPLDADLFLVAPNQAHAPIISELGRLGYAVTELPLYNRFLNQGGDPVGHYLFQGRIDAIFFPSPEHLRFFRRRLLGEGGVLAMLDDVQIYCWDDWTARVAREYGLHVTGITHALSIPAPSDTTPPD